MICLDKLKFCKNPECRAVLPADPENPTEAGFWVADREGTRVLRFQTRCKDCTRAARGRGKRRHAETRMVEFEGKMTPLRRCLKCDFEGYCLDDERSDFVVKVRAPYPRWSSLCRRCYNAKQREAKDDKERRNALRRQRHQERMMADMSYRERRRTRGRLYYREHPELQESRREANRRWKAKKKLEDPSALRDQERIRRRLKAEREGRTLRNSQIGKRQRNMYDACPDRYWVVQQKTGQLLVPARPFGRWLRVYQDETGLDDYTLLSDDLGANLRRVTSVMNGEQEWVMFDIVDRALTNSSRPGLEVILGDFRTVVEVWDIYDLYPSYPRRDYSGERGEGL